MNRSPLPKNVPGFLVALATAALPALFLSSCASIDREHQMIVSIPDQQLELRKNGVPVRRYPVSTSKFGLGDRPGTNCTPLGRMVVAEKHGNRAKPGTVFKSRKPTGEIIQPDAPGRDPIVSRIFWLKGTESQNANAYRRYIYIHGTAEERNIGRPVSYGCIRMRSQDVIDLYRQAGVGAEVYVMNRPLDQVAPPPKEVVVPVSGS